MKVGLILFSRDKQFLYGTSQDILSPITAKIETMSTYQWNEHTDVVDMGVTLGFLSSTNHYSRFFEMTGIGNNDAPEILEQSKIVNELLSSKLTEIAQSKENTLLGMAERYATEGIYYRYFNDGNKRLMSSWFKWTFPGKLCYHFVDKDTYYQVLEIGSRVYLVKTNLSLSADDYIVATTEVTYTPRLDVRSNVPRTDLTYDPNYNVTTFTVEHPYTSDCVVFGIGPGRFQGRVSPTADIQPAGLGWSDVTLHGDWTGTDIVIGYPYQMAIHFPTIFMTKEDSDKVKSDTRMYLTVHRIKLQFADVGMFKTTVKKQGKPDYVDQWEMSPGDHYELNTHEVMPTVFQTVPVYEKNVFNTIHLTSYHPTPASLLSMEWEGKISPKSYKSV